MGVGLFMKVLFHGVKIEISDWNKRLKMVTIVLSIITLISCVLTIFADIVIPGLSPLALGCVILFIGIRQLNSYFKKGKHKIDLIIGIFCTIIFGLDLYVGINQILFAIFKYIGLA